MRFGILVAAASGLLLAGEDDAARLLSRVAEEAEVFRSTAPKLIAQETLVQRARSVSRRFRPRVGDAALAPPKPDYRSREIVSEYAYSTLKSAPGVLHEFRQVISVDGRRVLADEKARTALASGIQSDDDRVKRRMLERFERHGLAGAATDFGQVILLFTRSRLPDYTFRVSGVSRIGAEPAVVLEFEQRAGAGSLLVFRGRKAIRNPLSGQIWARRQDGLPLRIVLRTSTVSAENVERHEATVDYARSPHGVLTPVSVVHRQFSKETLMVENVFRYSPFRLFKADAEVKFTEGPPLDAPQR